MNPDVAQLKELQDVVSEILAIEKALSTVPEHVSALKKKQDDLNAQLEAKSNELKAKKDDETNLERKIDESKSLLEKAKDKKNAVHNTKEYEAVVRELEKLEKSTQDNTVKLTELRKTVEAKQAEIDELAAQVKNAGAEIEAQMASDENEKAQARLNTLKDKQSVLEAKVPKQLLSKFKQVLKARNNLAVINVKDGSCCGCRMKLPPQLYVEVVKGQELLQCVSCSRILYFEDSKG